MTTYKHKLNGNTYTAIESVVITVRFGTQTEELSGVRFNVEETGEQAEMTSHQISKLLVS